jgi:HSP20 family protein
MLTRFTDYSDWPSFGFADFGRGHSQDGLLGREIARLLSDFERATTPSSPRAAVSFEDTGSSFVLRADVPGLRHEDLNVNVAGNTLTLSGERQLDAPEGYSAHRRERRAFRFDKSFELPSRVDSEKATATLKHGVLTLTLPKVAEAQPRQITVTAA